MYKNKQKYDKIQPFSLPFSSIETRNHKIDTNIFRLVIEMSLNY